MADASALAGARSLVLSLRSEGRVVATSRFDLAAAAVRDALYAKAWREAAAKARDPRGCSLPPPIMVTSSR